LRLECSLSWHLNRDGDGAVLEYFAKRPLRQRVIALVAAYAIALSSLIASFGAASAAAADVGGSGGVICHNAGQSAPAGGETNGKLCVDDCCGGCLMLMAALPPPPATSVAIPRSGSVVSHPLALALPAAAHQAKSHRSRAPPRTA
jgi:hypothetical protein